MNMLRLSIKDITVILLCTLSMSLIFAFSKNVNANELIYIKCEYTEILDRIDNDGDFPRNALPDCFPSDFDMMCKRQGVEFFAFDHSKRRVLFSDGRLIHEHSKDDNRYTDEKITAIYEKFSDTIRVGYYFHRVTGEYSIVMQHDKPKHRSIRTGLCEQINSDKLF